LVATYRVTRPAAAQHNGSCGVYGCLLRDKQLSWQTATRPWLTCFGGISEKVAYLPHEFSSEPSLQSFSPLQNRPLSIQAPSPQAREPSCNQAPRLVRLPHSSKNTPPPRKRRLTYRTERLVGVQQRLDFALLVLELAVLHSIFPVARLLLNVEV